MVETEERTDFHIRGHLDDFVRLMEEKLAAVDDQHPDGWGADSIDDLFDRADDRMDKLFTALRNGATQETIGGYAVDVANWMSMIADNAGYLDDFYGK
jgi:hypothetical protein